MGTPLLFIRNPATKAVRRRGHDAVAAALVLVLLSAAAVSAERRDLRLLEAAKNRDTAAVIALLKQKADVNGAKADGTTALHWAAHWDDVAIADRLIAAGAKVTVANTYGVTPVMLAAQNGSVAMVTRLLKAGGNPNSAAESGETPLLAAARTGNVDVVKALIGAGADVNGREAARGQTALMWAAAEKHLAVIHALVEQGADVHARTHSRSTPLMFVAREGDVAAARFLIDQGSDVNAVSSDGSTPLLVATVRGHVDLVEFLLARGANPNGADAGYTPLHWASGIWETSTTFDYKFIAGEWAAMGGIPSREAKLHLVKLLLSHGADVNARTTVDPPRFSFTLFVSTMQQCVVGATPFFIAAMSGDVEIMRVLAAAGADPRLPSKNNTTPLIVAAGRVRLDNEARVPEHDTLEAVKLAIGLGNEVNAANDLGETALHAAALAGLDTVADYLVAQGANLHAKTKAGKTPVAVAERSVVNSQVLSRPSTAALLRKLGGTQ